MSIATSLQRLQAAKTAIANAITAKGGTVGVGDGYEEFAADIGTIPEAVDYLASYFDNTITEYEFPAGTTSVPNQAFNAKSTFRKLTLPTSITSVGSYAVRSNSSALEIHYKGTEEEWAAITFAYATPWAGSQYAALYCDGQLVTEPRFPNGATSTSVAFMCAKSITSISLPASITKVTQKSFYDCINAANVTLNEGLTVIDGSAFQGCALTSVKFPSTLTNIGGNAFYYNRNLRSVDCTELGVENGAVKTVLANANAFQVTNAGLSFTFATQAIRDVYASATNWSSYASRMTWVGA